MVWWRTISFDIFNIKGTIKLFSIQGDHIFCFFVYFEDFLSQSPYQTRYVLILLGMAARSLIYITILSFLIWYSMQGYHILCFLVYFEDYVVQIGYDLRFLPIFTAIFSIFFTILYYSIKGERILCFLLYFRYYVVHLGV